MSGLAAASKTDHQNQANTADAKAKTTSARVTAIKDSLGALAGAFGKSLEEKGFLREYVALENAAADQSNPKLGFFLWLIRVMFFVIELLPTIVKLATPLGEYDRQLHAHEQMFALALDTNFRILQQREQLRQRTELVIAQRLEQARQDKEIELGESVLNQTASIQNDLATRMLKEWGKQERDKLKPTATPKSPPAPGPAPAPAGATPPAPEPVVAAPPPPPVPPVSPANASITPAALLRRWGLQPDAMREWYQFENGASDNRVRRYIGKGLETGQWEHPNGDINCLRVTFGGDTTEYTIQRLTNTEMVLEDATTGRVLSFVS